MIDEKVVESFLEHHGVKGQKWGVRKRRIASAVVGGGLGTLAIKTLMRKSYMRDSYKLIAGGATAVAGYVFAKKLLEKDAEVTARYLKKKGLNKKNN